MYYENYILINIEIPNFEEIKKKYFDNEGNKIVLLNDNYSIQSPFEYFTPVMNVDPDGHMPWWGNLLVGAGIIAALAVATVITAGFAGVGIGTAMSAGFTGVTVGTGVSGAIATVASGSFAGAVIGGFTSAAASAIMTACIGGSKEEIWNNASSSFMFGSALGAFSGGINAIKFTSNAGLNMGIHMAVNSAASVGSYIGQTLYEKGNLNSVSGWGLFISAVGGASAGNLSNSVARAGCYNYICNQGVQFVDFLELARKYEL